METAEREAETADTRAPHTEDRERTGARRPRAVDGAKAKTMVRVGVKGLKGGEGNCLAGVGAEVVGERRREVTRVGGEVGKDK